ncbi:MAG: hypothetical protein D6702_06485 [Planctomycetota bacterium]|nr:MAG: hypothetical protein D6702_06485 [Planctomycetota bacterium]
MIAWLCALLTALGAGGGPDGADAPARPNLVLILADDLGWSDLGCQGGPAFLSPRIDALAAEGMRFTDAYAAAPNCAPTRAALMTGLSGPRTGVLTVGSPARGRAEHRRLVPPPNRTELAPGFRTLAELLHQAGYRTGHFGKWHLGADPGSGPLAQGFEVNVGGDRRGHPPSHFAPWRKEGDGPLPGLEEARPGEYLTDRLTDEAIAWLGNGDRRPFFLYLSHYAVHTPIEAPAETVGRCRGRLGDRGPSRPDYAAMVVHLDRATGRLLDALAELGVADDTLVVFTSDNGGLGGYAAAGVPGSPEVTRNAPLKGGKGMLSEGGIRVPLIVRWPGRVPAGTIRAVPVTTLDLFPTLLSAAGIPLGDRPCDGLDLVPLLRGEVATLPARDLVWHMPVYLESSAARGTWRCTPSAAIRRGRWKLIETFADGRAELYDLAADPGERVDLGRTRPDRVRELRAALAAWRQRTGAPMPGPRPLR